MRIQLKRLISAAGIAAVAFAGSGVAANAAPDKLLNVSYDIARELFAEINPVFEAQWEKETGNKIKIEQSHAGSSKQARSILEGLQADLVTFNQVTDIDVLHEKGDLLNADWATEFPHNSSPHYSLPAFLVRKGNPKNIQSWDDLVKDGVQVIFPNPKTSGNARYTYLGAYADALKKNDGDHEKAQAFVKELFAHVPLFDTGGRAATQTFVRGTGDVLITFEAEVYGIQKQYADAGYEVVTPKTSVLAEFPVAIVDKVAEKRGSTEAAKAYLDFLYSEAGQEILARHFYRVRDENVSARFSDVFSPVELFTVDEVFGGWEKLNKEHFGSDGILEKLFVNR